MVTQHTFAASHRQAHALCGVLDDTQHGHGDVLRGIGHQQVPARLGIHTARSCSGRDHGHTHRHGLEDLVLRSACNGQRRHHQGGLTHIGLNLRNRARDRDASQGSQCTDLG